MRLVCISDTHGSHDDLVVPDGDVLVHAGDFTNLGTLPEVAHFTSWLRRQPHKDKLLIAGNHDFLFQDHRSLACSLVDGITYLEDASVTINGVRFYGSPWTPRFYDWAFMKDRGDELAVVWDRVPDDVDVLITHGPPLGILDQNSRGLECGCYDLGARVSNIRPRLHIFGHIHEGYGTATLNGTTFINASSTKRLGGLRPPIIIDI